MQRLIKPVSKLNKTREIDASTLSVITKGSDTVHCWISVAGEDANITLRFDRGPRAMICGFPHDWVVHDVPDCIYASESPTGREMYECDAIPEDSVYVSADTELELLRILKRCVARQFRDASWKNCCPTPARKQSILNKIQRKINALKAVSRG